MSDGDVIDQAAGLGPDSGLAQLRRQRPDVVRHAQGSYEAVFAPADEGAISRAERVALGLRIALLNRAENLARHYGTELARLDPSGRLAQAASPGAEPSAEPSAEPRLAAMLAHVDLVTTAPGRATPAHVQALATLGLSPHDIVALSQLVALVNYQARVVTGLQLLGASA